MFCCLPVLKLIMFCFFPLSQLHKSHQLYMSSNSRSGLSSSFQKNAGLKDPLEKAFSTSLVVFHEPVIEEFCPEAGKEWF